MVLIPNAFTQRMLEVHKAEGQAWLDHLPAILAGCADRWQITIGPPFANLSYHYVAHATRSDGAPVVLKAHSPTNEFGQESEALHLFDGRGMVRLLKSDPINHVMLLERLQPGTTLLPIVLEDDARATSIIATVMRSLWRPVPPQHPFPTVQKWGQGFTRLREYYNGGSGPFPPPLLAEAETLYAELSATMAEPMLLHGDLHHDNILSAQRQPWLAIDPKGLVGEPAYEVGAMLHNPMPQLLNMPNPGRVLARRVDQLASELNLDRARVRNWGLAQAVLSSWWTVEDHGYVGETALACAQLLSTIKT